MPRHPHVAHEPSRHGLEDFFEARTGAATSSTAEGPPRLVQRRYRTGLRRRPRPFRCATSARRPRSACSVRWACATCARSAIDGGTHYGGAFHHLEAVTRLANGQPSFDLQFAEMEQIRRRYGMRLRPLVPALRVFVGAAERDLPAVRTLAHSIGRHSTVPVQVIPLTGRARHDAEAAGEPAADALLVRAVRHPGDVRPRGARRLPRLRHARLRRHRRARATCRSATPQLLCSRQDEGPAEWQDSDWFHPGRQFSVMVLDCDRLGWEVDDVVAGLDAGRYSYRDLMFDMRVVPEDRIAETVPSTWNHLERYEAGTTRLLHYTMVPHPAVAERRQPAGPPLGAGVPRRGPTTARSRGTRSRSWCARAR